MSHHTRGRKTPATTPADAIDKVPRPPAEMGAEARAEWKRVLPVLVERRVLSPGDLAGVEAYCNAVGDAAQARAAIAKDGAYVTNARDELKRHPGFATLREANQAARQWAAELGLTPASRGRITSEGGASDEDDDNPLAV